MTSRSVGIYTGYLRKEAAVREAMCIKIRTLREQREWNARKCNPKYADECKDFM